MIPDDFGQSIFATLVSAAVLSLLALAGAYYKKQKAWLKRTLSAAFFVFVLASIIISNQRKNELYESQHPTFTEVQSEVNFGKPSNRPNQTGDDILYIFFGMENKGLRTASQFKAASILLPLDLKAKVDGLAFNKTEIIEDTVHGGRQNLVMRPPQVIALEKMKPFYFFIQLEYTDKETGKKYNQSFYRKWEGSVGGYRANILPQVSPEEKVRVDRYFKYAGGGNCSVFVTGSESLTRRNRSKSLSRPREGTYWYLSRLQPPARDRPIDVV